MDLGDPPWPRCRKCGGPVYEFETFLSATNDEVEILARCHGAEERSTITAEQAAGLKELEAF